MVTAETVPNPELIDMQRRFWIGLALALPVFVLEMGYASRRAAMMLGADDIELAAARPRYPGRAVGRLALLRARLAVAQDPQSQHVHIDRHGHRRRLGLQRHRHPRCPASSRRPSAIMTARSPSTSKPPPSSPCSCSSARSSNYAPASGPPAPSAHSSISHPRPRAASKPTAARRTSPSIRGDRRPIARQALATRCRSTA